MPEIGHKLKVILHTGGCAEEFAQQGKMDHLRAAASPEYAKYPSLMWVRWW